VAISKKQKKVVKKSVPAKATPVKKVAMKAALVGKKSPIDWKKQVHPLQDRLVVIELEAPKTTPGGLILLEADKSNGMRAKVVAVGIGKVNKKGKLKPLDVRLGDVVLVSSYAGSKVTFESQDAWIVREEDVLGVLS
jgi:chaperonin GroES